jgi:hypothetical protein
MNYKLCTDKDSYRYAARVLKQNAVEKQALNDIKIIAYTIIGDKRDFVVEQAKTGELFQGIPYGGQSSFKWRGKLKMSDSDNYEYYFFSNSEIGVWCKFIERVLGDQLFFPAVI